MTVIRPKHRIPVSQKGDTWQKEALDYYSSMCKNGIDENRASFLYRVAAGILEPSDYLYVVNPLNTQRKELQGYPSKVRNMDIISPALMVLMGEKGKRYINSQVIARNVDVESIKKKQEAEAVMTALQLMFRNELQMQGIDVGQQLDREGQPTQQPSFDKIKEETESIQDELSIQGQDSLDYIMWYNKLPINFREGFYDFLVTAAVASYRYLKGDDVVHECFPPHQLKYMYKEGLRFIEDAPACKRVSKMNINEILDKFKDFKGFEKMRKALESRMHTSRTPAKDYNPITGMGAAARTKLWGNLWGGAATYSIEDIAVEHIIFTSQQRVGILTTTDPVDGSLVEIEVDEDFIPREYESVDWEYRDQKWEGWIIDGEHYIGCRPLPITRAPAGEPDKCKNPYNGRVFNTRVVAGKSVVEKGYPYQMKHNIVHYYLERAVAKNLDKIVVMPTTLLSDKHDEKSTIYYSQATSFLWVDPTDSRRSMEYLNAVKVLDASLGQHIGTLTKFLESNKAEWENSIGINRQRRGETQVSEGKGVMEESIYRGTIMTEEIFLEYDEYQESDLQGLLDLSVYAFSEGKKAHYIKSDGTRAFLNINPENYIHGDYLVQVSGSGVDKENLDMMKSQALAFAQNQMKPSDIGRLLKSNNLDKLIRELDKMEQELAELQAAATQREEQVKEREYAHEKELKEMELAQKEADSVRKAQGQGVQTQPQEFGTLVTAQSSGNGKDFGVEAMKDETKRYEIAMKDKMNERDNKTALKNKVPGEK